MSDMFLSDAAIQAIQDPFNTFHRALEQGAQHRPAPAALHELPDLAPMPEGEKTLCSFVK